MKTIKINGLEIEIAEGLELVVDASGKIIVRHAESVEHHHHYVPALPIYPSTPLWNQPVPIWTQPTTVPNFDPFRPTITCISPSREVVC